MQGQVRWLHRYLENLSSKQECSALTSNLEGTALNCEMAKRANERDSARKIFDTMLNSFGSGVQGHQAMVKIEKRRQRVNEFIDKFLDDLELLRRRSNPDERISERNLAIASKFMDGIKSDELKNKLATHFTLSLDQVPTPDDLRLKSREYMLIKPREELATKEVEQWVRSELESTYLREKIDLLGKTTKEENKQEPRKQGLKINFISGKSFGMTKEGTKIMSIISVAGHQVVKNLSESSEITLVHLDIYADYLREKDPKLDSRAVLALLTTRGPRLIRADDILSKSMAHIRF